MNKELLLQELIEEIRARHLQPEDRYEVAALLESLGWNDARAAEAFGVEHVFELASLIWDQVQTSIVFTPFAVPEKPSLPAVLLTIVRQFLRGVIFALPMAVSVLSMVFLKFSLWSYENLTLDLATSIAIGTIISFVVVGGFTQAIARRGFFYITLGYYNMGRRITFHFIGLGFLVCIGVCGLIVAMNAVFAFFPYKMLLITILYFFFLNTIWLSVTVMYILQKELLFTGLIILGIGIVYTLFQATGNIIASQLISLAIVSGISILLVIYYFKKAEAKLEKGIAPQLPRMSIMLYSTMPYFIYGFLYFAFLFADRILAWSTTDSSYMPYMIWFRGGYELGLDFALLALIVPMGISEVVVSKLMTDLQVSQKGYMGAEAAQMNRHYLRMYGRRLLMIGAASAASALAIYKITHAFFGSGASGLIGSNLFSDAVSHFVYIGALAAYAIVAAALMNAVILFSMSQPRMVIDAIWPALLTNVIVGFLLSRWVGYGWAVAGLLCGAIVFSALSSRSVIRLFRNLDYYLYAAS